MFSPVGREGLHLPIVHLHVERDDELSVCVQQHGLQTLGVVQVLQGLLDEQVGVLWRERGREGEGGEKGREGAMSTNGRVSYDFF